MWTRQIPHIDRACLGSVQIELKLRVTLDGTVVVVCQWVEPSAAMNFPSNRGGCWAQYGCSALEYLCCSSASKVVVCKSVHHYRFQPEAGLAASGYRVILPYAVLGWFSRIVYSLKRENHRLSSRPPNPLSWTHHLRVMAVTIRCPLHCLMSNCALCCRGLTALIS